MKTNNAEMLRQALKPEPAPTPTLVLPMEYDGKFTVSYNLSDGSFSAFRVVPEVGSRIVRAVNCHMMLVDLLKRVPSSYSESLRKEVAQALAQAEQKP